MIDLLGEARNHVEFYQAALLRKNMGKADDWKYEVYKQKWVDKSFMDFPKTAKNPQLLKRSLLLVARWCLYHGNPVMSFSETLDFLDTWYTTVMQFACKGMKAKDSAQTKSMVQEQSKKFKDNNERFKNLDKINYYRLVCQAQSDGPLTSVQIKIPFRILDVWKERKTPKNDRGLHILYHYNGEMPGVTKTDIECWLTGYSSSLESECISCANSPGKDGGRIYFLNVDSAFRWDDTEDGIEVSETPRFANELEDKKLEALRIQIDPDYWMNTRLSTSEEMLSHYAKKKDLSTQSAESGKLPKVNKLRRCVLAMLYAADGNAGLSSWGGWNELLSRKPPLVPWKEKIYLDWTQIEQWTRDNYGVVISAMNGNNSSEHKSVGEFFKGQGEKKYFAESGTDSKGNYLKFYSPSQG